MPVRTLVGMVPRNFCSWGWSFVGFYCVERAGHRRRDDRGAPSHMSGERIDRMFPSDDLSPPGLQLRSRRAECSV
jgi:hypothetical protein